MLLAANYLRLKKTPLLRGLLLHRLNPRARKEDGFTLIEIMITVAILGILSAIAMSVSMQYRQKAYEKQVLSDVRNAATAEEGYFVNHTSYAAFGPVTGVTEVTLEAGTTFRVSDNTTIEGIIQADGSIKLVGSHPGSINAINYESTIGAFTQQTTP